MRKITKNGIAVFAIFGAVLLLSTVFTQPVSVQASKSLLKNSNSDNITVFDVLKSAAESFGEQLTTDVEFQENIDSLIDNQEIMEKVKKAHNANIFNRHSRMADLIDSLGETYEFNQMMQIAADKGFDDFFDFIYYKTLIPLKYRCDASGNTKEAKQLERNIDTCLKDSNDGFYQISNDFNFEIKEKSHGVFEISYFNNVIIDKDYDFDSLPFVIGTTALMLVLLFVCLIILALLILAVDGGDGPIYMIIDICWWFIDLVLYGFGYSCPKEISIHKSENSRKYFFSTIIDRLLLRFTRVNVLFKI